MRSLGRLVLLIAVVAAACGKSSPTSPTPSPAATSTRVISLGGSLAFGNVEVGKTSDLSFTISNSGSAVLTVSGMTGPAGYASNWTSGPIAAGASQQVLVRFSPTAAQTYNGTLTINGDHTGGTNTMSVSGTGTNPAPTAIPLTGTVTASATGARIGDAIIIVLDGPDVGRITTTNSNGDYRFDALKVGNANCSAWADGYSEAAKGVYVNGTNTLNFVLTRVQTPVPNPTPTPTPGPSPGCCKVCTTGKPCGDSCINKSYTCNKGPGCACAG